ncbi:9813_t:CDS:1, partial [Cetraspora pellucida]
SHSIIAQLLDSEMLNFVTTRERLFNGNTDLVAGRKHLIIYE